MEEKKLTAAAPPMVLFHDDEYTPFGLDTEFTFKVFFIGYNSIFYYDYTCGISILTVYFLLQLFNFYLIHTFFLLEQGISVPDYV